MHVITAHIIHNFIHINQGIKNNLYMLYSFLELFISDTVTQNYHNTSIYISIRLFHITCHPVGLESHVTDRTKRCDSGEFINTVKRENLSHTYFSLNVSAYSMAEINCNTRTCFKRFFFYQQLLCNCSSN